MKIAFISTMAGSPWGGSEELWSGAALRLLAGGHEVLASVVSWPAVPGPLAELERRGAVVDRRPRITPLWRRGVNRLRRAVRSAADGDPAWRRIRRFRPDLVCISQGTAMCGVDWMLRCLRAGIPYAVICQANYENWWPDDGRAEQVRTAFEGCRHAGFVSHRNRQLCEAQIAAPLPRSEVVRNPFVVPYDAAPEWPGPAEPLRLACVARLDPKAKGQDLIVAVLAAEKWRRRGLHVSLFGSGPCSDNLRRLLELHGLESSITFAGHVDDVLGIWRTHHALLLPSRYEGLPLALVEAMLCGRIGIVTDVAGNTEVVEDDVTGFVAAAPTAWLLDAALERAWARRDAWREMGRMAARAIRRAVPADPAAVYADKLLALARGEEPGLAR
jgi:glycosyltransferase involved in cell wall biosynthesis